MTTCAHPRCGKRLIPVRLPDGSFSTRHPTPQCDPDGQLDAPGFRGALNPDTTAKEATAP